VYPHLVAWAGVGKDTERSYFACLGKISQNVSRKKMPNVNHRYKVDTWQLVILGPTPGGIILEKTWSIG
jgi:hypothetical protein